MHLTFGIVSVEHKRVTSHRLVKSAIYKGLFVVYLSVYDTHPLVIAIIFSHNILGIVYAIITLQSYSHILVQCTTTTFGIAAILHIKCNTKVAHNKCHCIALFCRIARAVCLEHSVPVVVILLKVHTYLHTSHIIGWIVYGMTTYTMLGSTMVE